MDQIAASSLTMYLWQLLMSRWTQESVQWGSQWRRQPIISGWGKYFWL